MPRYFSATLLLDAEWPMDIDLVAQSLTQRFPQIGDVDALPGQAEGDTGLLTIEGAQIVLQSSAGAIAAEDAFPKLKVLRTWDPMPAFHRHAAHITVSCGGRLPGIEGAQAYAAVTHFVATAVAGLARPSAVLWDPARQLIDPTDFAVAAETLLTGTLPLSSWVGYAPVVPDGAVGRGVTGMVTYGLRPFVGNEIELAPRPGDPRAAYRCAGAVVRRVLQDRLELSDGLEMVDRRAGIALTVRERRYWLRRDESAFVLVSDDSAVDPWSLRPRDRDVA